LEIVRKASEFQKTHFGVDCGDVVYKYFEQKQPVFGILMTIYPIYDLSSTG